MQNTEWQKLTEALKNCRNSYGTLHYNYDARLANAINRYSPKNGYPFIKDHSYYIDNPKETAAAIENWVKAQAEAEDTCIITNAQLLLNANDKDAKEKAEVVMKKEKRLLERATCSLDWDEFSKRRARDSREYVDTLFALGCAAIEEFQKTPTALILFPKVVIEDIPVFGGFYGSPWSTKNAGSLNLKFRMINPHFEIAIATVQESNKKRRGWDEEIRKAGVLFTYINP